MCNLGIMDNDLSFNFILACNGYATIRTDLLGMDTQQLSISSRGSRWVVGEGVFICLRKAKMQMMKKTRLAVYIISIQLVWQYALSTISTARLTSLGNNM